MTDHNPIFDYQVSTLFDMNPIRLTPDQFRAITGSEPPREFGSISIERDGVVRVLNYSPQSDDTGVILAYVLEFSEASILDMKRELANRWTKMN